MIKKILKLILPQTVRTKLKRQSWFFVQAIMEASGFTVALKEDFYSPLSSVKDLKETEHRWNKPSLLQGIDFDLKKMENFLAGLVNTYKYELSDIPPFSELVKKGYGPGFTAIDGLTLYMMIRHFKPKQYIEIGSGLSTYYCYLAAEKNALENQPLNITCIDPYPYKALTLLPSIKIIQKEVQDIELAVFEELQENDIFFIDSSHMVKVGSDVPYLVLEALPSLKSGVNVHVHDIPFPYNIPFPPSEYVFNQPFPLLWNEAMMIQAFLCYNRNFSIELSTPLIRYHNEEFLRKSFTCYESVVENPRTFCSLWMRRVS
jgi:Methyltransferase domain